MHLSLIALLVLAPPQEPTDVGPLVRALWLVQSHGKPEAVNSANDQRMKGVLAKALAKDGVITIPELRELMGPESFNRIAGRDAKLEAAEIERALAAATPESRTRLAPR